ncbi:MAG: lamin tail domain-containing protein, partial [Myxococcota bacterium]|nr:lamin tail domain-containing protein [Myxococcota bacterium]
MRWLIALGAALTLVMTGCGGDDSTGGGGDNLPDVASLPEVVTDVAGPETTTDGGASDADTSGGDATSVDVGPDADEGDASEVSDVSEADGAEADVEPDIPQSEPGGPCLEHTDCAADLFCINYECHSAEDGVGQPCGSDSDCVEGLFCVDNQCGDKPIVCGDGVLDEGEECDNGTANSDVLPNTCRESCVLPFCGDGVTDTGEGCDDANQDETDGCSVICVSNVVYAKPQEGELLITELMINPAAASDPFGEWIEIFNATDQTLSLVGCEVHDQGTDIIALGEGTGYLVIEPGQHLVLGFSDDLSKNGGVDVNVVYGTMLLDNVTDEVVITCPSGVVDEVAYGTVLFPIQSGSSMSLDAGSMDAESNDLPFSWCPGGEVFGAGDYGTPGQANAACPEADVTVDHCEVASSPELTHIKGIPAELVVHITEAGLTDQTSGVDTTAALWVQVGFGPSDSAAPDGSWTWSPASPVNDWDDESGKDAHQGVLNPDVSGLWHGAARVSLDAGETWTYCDLPPGSSDGFQSEAVVQLNTIDDPCLTAVCDAPPASMCAQDGITAHIFDVADATCSVEDWVAV